MHLTVDKKFLPSSQIGDLFERIINVALNSKELNEEDRTMVMEFFHNRALFVMPFKSVEDLNEFMRFIDNFVTERLQN